MPLGLSSPVNFTWLKIFNVSSNYEISCHIQSVETYYPMHLLKFMKFTKFSWRIHWPTYYRRFSISCFLANGNTFQTAFKNPNRVVFEGEWNENINSLSFGICLHINVSQAKPNYLFNLYFIWSTCLSVLQSNLVKSISLFFCIKTIALKKLTIKK